MINIALGLFIIIILIVIFIFNYKPQLPKHTLLTLSTLIGISYSLLLYGVFYSYTNHTEILLNKEIQKPTSTWTASKWSQNPC